ncbi:MAG: response regulator [Candidatus Nitrohelix vancouverensis]|uniref:Response regulator n=1 Tax=Candidatus Nitrohelix vancouverensis TaxID=2705534 RepID=A0A7T0C2Q3_9BACT|nr:MAG: response regulator [Candidatus Nitrohelix vancouverensis]
MDITKNAKKFLCIDDDRTLQLIVKQILGKAFGPQMLELSQAVTGEEGLRLVKDMQPDIILCDIQMPGMDGFEVCKKIRQFQPHCAVILMSAYDAESDNAIKASEVGADAYLSKPLKKGELLFVVNFVMRVAHLNDAIYEKNKQLESSLEQLKQFHQKLAALNNELIADKRRLGASLRDMTELNRQMEEKNTQISSMVEELASRSDSTVGVLASIIELNQSGHRGHSDRVADMAVFISEKMNLTDYQVRNIKTAAQLHELGIVALPTKEKRDEAADESENRAFSSHPLVGEMLLKGYPGFELVADMIRHLHENVDGSGSPDGLYGDRIPIGSRIIACASFYDHAKMANPESTIDSVLEEMDGKSGMIFDETVLGHLSEYVNSVDTEGVEKTMDCTVFALAEGMELATDIFSESGINLLRKGTVLNKEILSKVLKFHNMDPIAGTIKVKQPQ